MDGTNGGYLLKVFGYMVDGHNVFNGLAGLINIFCMTGWWAVYSSKDEKV